MSETKVTSHEANSIGELNRDADWSGLYVTVVGAGVAGVAAAAALATVGALVELTDRGDFRQLSSAQQEVIAQLTALGAVIARDSTDGWGGRAPDLLVVSPGVKPFAHAITRARELGIPIWGELELAWRLQSTSKAAQWLLVSGTNGKTTTTLMAEAMANAGSCSAWAVGNIGASAVEAVMREDQPDLLVVETSAAQMVFTQSLRPLASVVLNFAPDHIDYFGSMATYQAAKSSVYRGVTRAAIFNLEDLTTRRMIDQVGVAKDVKLVGFSLREPAEGELGVAGGYLVDRAFGHGDVRLCAVDEVHPAAAHNVANALAAAGLVRAAGVDSGAISAGLLAFEPAAHRITDVGTVAGIRFIDDSKATNAHAAATSIAAYPSVIWIAGGLAKGQDFSGLIQEVRNHLRGVVLIGRDKGEIAAALQRHSPDTPVISIAGDDATCMPEVVGAARSLALRGDVVLLAPACASWDMFTDYQHRGDTFAQAVRGLSASVGAA